MQNNQPNPTVRLQNSVQMVPAGPRRITQTQAAHLYVMLTTGRRLSPIQKAYWDQFPEKVSYVEFANMAHPDLGLNMLV